MSWDRSETAPIEPLKPTFLEALEAGSVVVEAPTGSGKSTRLPLWCAERGRVLVVEPRRLACRSLARYLAQRRDAAEPWSVGYAVRFDLRCERSTRLVFATPGIALRWYAESRLAGFDTVVLDEFHERRWDTDLLAAMLVEDRRRLVLTSATFESRRLAGYLGGPRLRSEAASFPVEVRYTLRDALPSRKDLEKRVAGAVQEAFRKTAAGDVLVFLPGRGEIEDARRELERREVPAEVIPLHASVQVEQQDRALKTARGRRIILATNVAETSLTIPGVRAVVDSGLERRTQHRNGRTVLGLCSISQAAAEQRRGRAGRLGPGLCLRLWGEAAQLEATTPPEVQREELTELFLAAAACGHSADALRFPDPLPEHAAARARERLRAMGALDARGGITERGRQLFPLPLEPLLGHLILAMPDAGTRGFMLDLAAALSVDGWVFSGPSGEKEAEALRRWAPEACDASTLVRMVRSDPPKAVRVNRKALEQARRIAEQLQAVLGLAPSRSQELPRGEALLSAARAAPELVFVRRRPGSRTMGNAQAEVEIGSATRMPEKAQAAVVLQSHSLPGKGTTRTVTYASCLAPLPMERLAEAGLGRVDLEAPRVDAEGRIRATAVRRYAGRRIEEREILPQGAELRQALARLIVSGELFPGAGRQLEEDVRAWNLALDLGLYHGQQVEPKTWLVERLARLGLEAQEDVELLDPPDLRFPGIPEEERPQFDRRYPRRLHLGDLELDVNYEAKGKTITLVKRSGQRRTPPTRMELPSWGREWRLRYKEGNRVVPLA